MRWIVRVYTLVLLVYTGWRTYDFMMHQLPAGDLSFWLAILFLFATEARLAIWHEVSISHTSTYTQHYVAVSLTWLDFAGSLSAGVADMILRQTFYDGYQVPSLLATGLIYGLPLLVAINVAGALVYLANDAEQQLEREKRFIDFEASRQALRQVGSNRRVIAQAKRDALYDILADERAAPPRQTVSIGKLPASNNGKVDHSAEVEVANPTRASRKKRN